METGGGIMNRAVGMLVVLAVTMADAALVRGEATLASAISSTGPCQGIDVESGTVRHNVLRNEMFMGDTVDMVYRLLGLADDFGCGCGGPLFALYSRNATYVLSPTIAADAFAPIDLSDTAVARPGTALGLLYTCPVYCGLTLRKIPWYAGKTREGHYFLVHFLSVREYMDTLQRARFQASRIEWYLQTDGSLNFAGSPLAVSRSAHGQSTLRADAVRGGVHTWLAIGRNPPVAGLWDPGAVDCRGRSLGRNSPAVQPRRTGMRVQQGTPRR
jgi:hypothetical protein